MAPSKNLVATAPLVIVTDGEGKHLYLYEGMPVPDHADADDVKRLVKRGMLGTIEHPEPTDPAVEQPQGYDSKTVADLEAEITSRNDGRDADKLIVVGGNGNKPDLVAALEADDAALAAANA